MPEPIDTLITLHGGGLVSPLEAKFWDSPNQPEQNLVAVTLPHQLIPLCELVTHPLVLPVVIVFLAF